MAGTDRKPAIRFAGYTDEWEQRKLEEIAAFSKGRGYSKNDLTEAGTPIILYGRLYTKYQTLISEVDTFAVNKPNSVYSLGNDVIVPASGESAEDIARASVVEKPGVLLGGDLNIVYPNDDLDAVFLALSVSHGNQQKGLSRKAQGKSVVHLHNADLQEVELSYPYKQEQVEISRVFRNFDSLITFQQSKVDKLVIVKKSMLEKMFPKDGADVPEIRFAGFTDAWERRKLGEVLNQTIEYVNPQAENIELWSLTIENGLTPKTDRYVRDFLVRKEDKYKAVYPNDVVYNPMNMTLGAIGYNNMSKTVAVSGYYITMKPTEIIDGYYIKTWMQRPYALKLYKMCATGSLLEKQRVQYPAFAEINFSVPKIDEQKKIADFFTHIDSLVILHQRKLAKLKNIKKALLEKMFV